MEKIIVFLALAVALLNTSVSTPSDQAQCEGRRSPVADVRILACSALLSLPGRSGASEAEVLVNRAWAYIAAGRLSEARRDYDRAVYLAPHSHVALNERALYFLRTGALVAALRDYNAAIADAPGAAYPRYGRGLTRYRMGDRTGGDEDIAAARAIDPGIDKVFAAIGFRAGQ